MFACICRAVTTDEVSMAIDNGAATLAQVARATERLSALRIGQTISQMLESDMAIEVEAVDRLRRGIEYTRSIGDVTSANIFEGILSDEEEHIDYLETQQGLISQLGEQLYLAQLVEQPDD